jgi:signal peptidase I
MCEIISIKSNKLFPVIRDLLKNGMRTRITVTGMSMYPFLREYIDSVELSNSNFKSIHYGDIVLIERKSGEYVLHRVVRKEEYCFYIVGDAQHWVEGPLSPDQLIAVVTAIWRKNKKIECSNFWWKLPSLIWLRLLLFRRLITRTHSLLSKFTRTHKKLYKEGRT